MKSRSKALLVLAAILALVAVPASNAFAAHSPHWVVEGKTFTGTEALTAGNSTAFKLEVPAFVTISCTTVSANGEIKEEYKDASTGGIKFSGCTVPAAPVCTVRSPGEPVGTIKTNPLKTELLAVETAIYDKFETASANFVEIEVLGAECAAKGTFPVTGTVAGKQVGTVPAATIHQEFSKANSTASGTALKFGTKSAYLYGTATFTLSSGKSWQAAL